MNSVISEKIRLRQKDTCKVPNVWQVGCTNSKHVTILSWPTLSRPASGLSQRTWSTSMLCQWMLSYPIQFDYNKKIFVKYYMHCTTTQFYYRTEIVFVQSIEVLWQQNLFDFCSTLHKHVFSGSSFRSWSPGRLVQCDHEDACSFEICTSYTSEWLRSH